MEIPVNKSYCATVVRLKNRFALPKRDKIEAAQIFGYQVIFGKDTPDLGIFFPAETQLSDEYCFNNNLYRHGHLNKIPDQAGYIEDNRRVRAIKFCGHVSNGFFMPIDSLAWTGIDVNDLKEGDEFDFLNGKEVCRKYVVPTKAMKGQALVDRGFIRFDKKFMPEHIDTDNFFRNEHKVTDDTDVIITQKLHGTSVRIGNTTVNRRKNLIEKIAAFFGAKIQTTEHAYLYGSRKVIKDANNVNQKDYYSEDIWTIQGKKLDGLIPENYLVYGELIGWTSGGKPIQEGYTYGIPKGNCELYIYRIAIVNGQGVTTDLSWNQVKEFCSKNGLKYVPELGVERKSNLTREDCKGTKDFLDKRFFDEGFKNAIQLGEDKEIVDEGICIRAEGLTPVLLKAKSPKFLEYETKILATGEQDLESSQSESEVTVKTITA